MGTVILVVEDEPDLRSLVSMALGTDGFTVVEAADADAAFAALGPDLAMAVIDIGLPGMSGLDLLAEIRRTSTLPVIMLTAAVDEHSRISGLDAGADDYVAKPFSLGELRARVRSLLRRSSVAPSDDTFIDHGRLTIDLAAREVRVDGEPVVLTRREFDLLAFLAARPRLVHDVPALLVNVWSSSPDWQDRHTVAEHVRRLRHKVGDEWVATVRGAGYRFEPHR